MRAAGFVASGMVMTVRIRGFEFAAGRRSCFIHRAMGVAADTAAEIHALGLMFVSGAFHARMIDVERFDLIGGNGVTDGSRLQLPF